MSRSPTWTRLDVYSVTFCGRQRPSVLRFTEPTHILLLRRRGFAAASRYFFASSSRQWATLIDGNLAAICCWGRVSIWTRESGTGIPTRVDCNILYYSRPVNCEFSTEHTMAHFSGFVPLFWGLFLQASSSGVRNMATISSQGYNVRYNSIFAEECWDGKNYIMITGRRTL